MNADNWVILVTLLAYLLFMLWIGFRISRRISGIDDYILAGRNLPWFVLTLTFLATLANTAQVMGQPGFSYQTGLSYLFWGNLASLTVGALLLPRIGSRLRGLELSTVTDFAGARFPGSRRVHYLVLVWQVAWGVFVTALSLFGASLLIEVVTGLPWQAAILIIAVVTIAYTVAGGLRAVVITDSVQWMIIIIGTAVFIPLIFLQEGSFASFFARYLGESGFSPTAAASEASPNPGFTDIFTLPPGLTYIPSLLAFILAISLWVPIDLGFVQRMLSARSAGEGRKGAYTFLAMQILVISLLIALGMYGRVLLPGLQNFDKIIVLLAQDTLPLLGAALFVAAVAAAAMSTISTYLNAGSSIIVKNVIMEFKPDLSDERRLMLTRVFTAVVCLAALSFAPFISADGIVAAAVAVQIVLVTALSPVILLGVFWKRLSERGAFWGCLVTSVATLVLVMAAGGPNVAINSAGFFGIPVIFWGFIIGAVFFVGLSLLEPYRPEAMGEGFRAIFEGRTPKVPTTDVKVLGGLWLALLILGVGWQTLVGRASVFPPLSGPLAWLTDAYFLVTSAVVLVASAYMLVKLIGYVRREVAPESETSGAGEPGPVPEAPSRG